jgi:pimeloyl-ACP methyl ester carboxylesterase
MSENLPVPRDFPAPLRHPIPARSFLRIGYFRASMGAAAALVAAAEMGAKIGAVVSRGGRPDMAGEALPRVISPTLLLVGGLDELILQLNEEALQKLRCKKEMRIVPGATHLFEEPDTLEEVARLASDWFFHFLQPKPTSEQEVE